MNGVEWRLPPWCCHRTPVFGISRGRQTGGPNPSFKLFWLYSFFLGFFDKPNRRVYTSILSIVECVNSGLAAYYIKSWILQTPTNLVSQIRILSFMWLDKNCRKPYTQGLGKPCSQWDFRQSVLGKPYSFGNFPKKGCENPVSLSRICGDLPGSRILWNRPQELWHDACTWKNHFVCPWWATHSAWHAFSSWAQSFRVLFVMMSLFFLGGGGGGGVMTSAKCGMLLWLSLSFFSQGGRSLSQNFYCLGNIDMFRFVKTRRRCTMHHKILPPWHFGCASV